MSTSTSVLPASLSNKDLFQTKMFINGKFVNAESNKVVEVKNPATGECLGSIPHGGSTDTQRAIDAAQASFTAWADTPVAERCAIVKKWGELMIKNKADLAFILTTEQGKPLAEAGGEIAYAAGFLDFFAKYGEEGMKTEIIANASKDAPTTMKAIKAPVGVVGAITPWYVVIMIYIINHIFC